MGRALVIPSGVEIFVGLEPIDLRWGFDRLSGLVEERIGRAARSGVKSLRLPARSPNLNAYAERFVRSIKSECLRRVVPLGENHLRELVHEYVAHYLLERNHQGLGNKLIEPSNDNSAITGRVVRRKRLGGTLTFYSRAVA
jgi:putative transposase